MTTQAQGDALAPSSPPLTLYDVDAFGTLRLHFHEGQARTWMSTRRLILMLAGTQGGKTSFGPWWMYREIYGFGEFRGLGKGDYLAVTSSFDLFKQKMLPEIRTVYEDVMKVGRYWAGDRVMELINPQTGEFAKQKHRAWGRLILRSAAAPSGLESATAKAAWLDEVGQDEWDVTIFEAILRRLSLSQGRVLGTTTVYNSGWLKSDWQEPYLQGDPDYDVVRFDSTVNPAFPKAEYERAKRTMPEARFQMFYRGMFGKLSGLIYPDFNDNMMVKPFTIPDDWPIYIGLDFGGVNGASVFVAEDTSKRESVFYIYADYLEGNVPIAELVQRTKDRLGDRDQFTLTGGAGSEDDWRREWGFHGLYVSRPEVGSVEVGILSVTSLIKSGRLKVFKSCPGVRHELVTYRRKVDAQGEVLDVIVDKAKFHRLDAIRYFAVLVTGGDPQIF